MCQRLRGCLLSRVDTRLITYMYMKISNNPLGYLTVQKKKIVKIETPFRSNSPHPTFLPHTRIHRRGHARAHTRHTARHTPSCKKEPFPKWLLSFSPSFSVPPKAIASVVRLFFPGKDLPGPTRAVVWTRFTRQTGRRNGSLSWATRCTITTGFSKNLN